MKTLTELINCVLEKLCLKYDLPDTYCKIDNFISDDDKSAEFIRKILLDDSFQQPNSENPLFNIAKVRARHSALSFLIGLVFKKYGGLYNSFSQTIPGNNDATLSDQIWLVTSLNHDCGFFSDYILKKDLFYRQRFTYKLLSDTYSEEFLQALCCPLDEYTRVLAYSYSDIEEYDNWAMGYHEREDDKEKIDHGILGGCLLFDRTISKAKKRSLASGQLRMIKACALTIAQHNMFKSSSPEDDEPLPKKPKKLQCFSTFKISRITPILLFLSLIDTFECVKKFSKSENDSEYLQTMTVLDSIALQINANTVEIDYSNLYREINSKHSESLDKNWAEYKEAMKRLDNWTTFTTYYDEISNTCEIVLPSRS